MRFLNINLDKKFSVGIISIVVLFAMIAGFVSYQNFYQYQLSTAELYNLLFLQVIFVLVLIGCAFYLARVLITSRIAKVAQYVTRNPIATPELGKLELKPGIFSRRTDEIDSLVELLNGMYQRSMDHQNEQLKIRTDAERTSQMKTFFLASMSHELRTPLNAILCGSEIIQEEGLNRETRKYLDLQVKAGEYLRHLIDDILDLTKIEAEELQLNYTDTDFYSLLKSSIEILKPRASEHNNELKLEVAMTVPKIINIDSNRLMQIIFNIAGNSCKFTRNGKISIEVGLEGDNLKITFSDTGIGIPEDQLRQIFEPFKQLDNSGKMQNLGAGIGLAVCHGLAVAMKGTIEVSSQVGKGTTFILQLPLRMTEACEALVPQAYLGATAFAKQQNLSPKKPEDRPLNILVAEDTEDNVLVLKAFLKKRPYILDVVEDGQLALEAFKLKKYDMVLMDLQMPRMDGYEATRQIRSWENENRQQSIPIIALTAFAAANDLNKSITAGCNSFLTKPFKREALLNVMDKYVV